MHDEITLRPSRAKQAIMLIVSGLFVLGGIFTLDHEAKTSDAWTAYGSIIFFGLCSLVSAIQLLPGSSFLKIRKEGFEFRALWRETSCSWSDVEKFGVAEFTTYHAGIPQKHRMVGFRLSHSSHRPSKHLRLRRLSEALVGYEAALPDNYGMKHEELASLMNQKKMEYGGQG